MSVTVSFYESIKKKTGVDRMEFPMVADLSGLITLLGEKFGLDFRDFLLGDDTCFFLINGKSILGTGGLGTPLAEGDLIEVLPVIEAG